MADIYVSTSGSDSTGTGASGSPYATVGKAAGVMSGGDRILVKLGTYTQTSTTANVSGGVVDPPAGSSSSLSQIEGYQSTPGDLEDVDVKDATNAPVFQGFASSFWLFELANAGISVKNMVFDGANAATHGVWGGTSNQYFQNLKFINCPTNCLTLNSASTANRILAIGGQVGINGASAQELFVTNSVADGFSSTGFKQAGSSAEFRRCIARLGTGTAVGFLVDGPQGLLEACVSYKNGGDGAKFGTSTKLATISDNILYGNGGYGINQGSATLVTPFMMNYNASGSNTSGDLSANLSHGTKDITGISDPFSNGSAAISVLSDAWTAFQLSAGGATALNGKAYMPYLAIGATQPQNSGGSTTIVTSPRRVTIVRGFSPKRDRYIPLPAAASAPQIVPVVRQRVSIRRELINRPRYVPLAASSAPAQLIPINRRQPYCIRERVCIRRDVPIPTTAAQPAPIIVRRPPIVVRPQVVRPYRPVVVPARGQLIITRPTLVR